MNRTKRESVYEFSGAERSVYESMEFPLAAYQYIDGRVITLLVSDGFCRLKNRERGQLIDRMNQSMFQDVHPEDAGKLAETGRNFANHRGAYDVIYRSWNGMSEYLLIHAIGRYQKMDNGTELAFLLYVDITESEKRLSQITGCYYRQLQDQFYIDRLTNLPNINYFHEFADEKVAAIFAEKKEPAVIFINLNNMGYINEKYGIADGDLFLKRTAEMIRGEYTDSMCVRVADDHFAILTDRAELTEKLDRLEDKIRKISPLRGVGFRAGISHMEAADMKAVIALDQARFACREIGKDKRISYKIYTSRLDAERLQERYILANFNRALSEKWIKVYYQAIADIRSRSIFGFEGLARWMEPEGSELSPMDFIPVLEKNHLIHKLDLYILEQIIAEISLRREAGADLLPVSVNLSVEGFDEGDLPKRVSALLEKYGESPEMVIIEITERDFSRMPESFKRQEEELRRMGIKIWVDDFGSGYSSLNVLHLYRFDLIKIDMSFIQNMDFYNREIMKAIRTTANHLGIMTLTEGVETLENHEFLDSISCDLGQGYYYMKPLPLHAILKDYGTKDKLCIGSADCRK